MFGSLYGLGAVIMTRKVYVTLDYYGEHLWLVFEVFAFSFLGYISVTLILSLIALFGAAEAELVKYLRRTLTIVNSFVIFRKPLTTWHAVGFAFVILSYTFTFRSNGRQVAPSASVLMVEGQAKCEGKCAKHLLL